MKKKPKNKGNFHRFIRPEKRQKKGEEGATNPLKEDIRLNKYVAHCGVAARRKASEYIQQGLVKVNGEIVLEPGYRVKAGDQVYFEDQLIQPETEMVYILLNKPRNAITTLQDEKGRRTVMDLIDQPIPVRIFPVGRLDRETTGLLLLTNDGELAKKLTHPSHEVSKIYHAKLDQPLSEAHLQQIAAGLTLEDGPAPVDSISYVKGKAKNEVGLEIHIGRNRIVRRIFEHLGYRVTHLDRTYYAGLTKKDLPRGRYRFLRERELVMLRHFT
ncbi:MAG: pseudouridine synthase [Bacteroidota bacterium]